MWLFKKKSRLVVLFNFFPWFFCHFFREKRHIMLIICLVFFNLYLSNFNTDKISLKRNNVQSPVVQQRCPAKLLFRKKQFPKSTEIWLLNGCMRWSLTPKSSQRYFFLLKQNLKLQKYPFENVIFFAICKLEFFGNLYYLRQGFSLTYRQNLRDKHCRRVSK